jgi:hypothetical protein
MVTASHILAGMALCGAALMGIAGRDGWGWFLFAALVLGGAL